MARMKREEVEPVKPIGVTRLEAMEVSRAVLETAERERAEALEAEAMIGAEGKPVMRTTPPPPPYWIEPVTFDFASGRQELQLALPESLNIPDGHIARVVVEPLAPAIPPGFEGE